MFNSSTEAHKTLKTLRDSLESNGTPLDSEIEDVFTSLQQVFDIFGAVEQKSHSLSSTEIADIGEQGILLIDNLISYLSSNNLESEKRDIEQVALIIAQWVIEQNGQLNNIHSIVDGLAYLANALQDQESLIQLADFMGLVAHSCSAVIKHDLDNSDPSRPWRILNINRGIIATRSHDLELMRAVFAEIITAIPLDAPDFFAEGMSEMVALDYPDEVRELMQEFFEQTTKPSVH